MLLVFLSDKKLFNEIYAIESNIKLRDKCEACERKFDRLTGEKNDGFRDFLSSETKIVSTDSIKN